MSVIEPNQIERVAKHLHGSQMTEQDIEYIMARIAVMDDAKKNLDRAIREDKKYIREVMGEREELVSRSYTASTTSLKRQSE